MMASTHVEDSKAACLVSSSTNKTVSIVVPCFNEVDNVVPMSDALMTVMGGLPQYDYEIVFIDNCSKDGTRDRLREICRCHKEVKAILNVKNFGQFNSPYYGLCQADGDCAVLISCDFQDPVELIPKLLDEWESGYKLVCPVKKTSKENGVMYFLRSCYYKLIRRMSDIEQIEHFTGFGLYDRSFIDTISQLDDSAPFLRGVVAELGPARKEIPYEQQLRRSGKTHNNFFTLYDGAMLSFTSYTKGGLRIATLAGFALSVLSIVAALVYLILKLTNWEAYPAGAIPVLLAVLFFGSVQLFFIGLLGEYILSINTRVMHRPLVVEEERINFDDEEG